MKRATDPACPEYGLTRTALRASGRADILLFLLVSTIGVVVLSRRATK